MIYMAVSLSVTVVGLILGYLFFQVQPMTGKTLTMPFYLETIARDWGKPGRIICPINLPGSEATLLLIAPQAGRFIGAAGILEHGAGPLVPVEIHCVFKRPVLASNGIVGSWERRGLLLAMVFTGGSVKLLIVSNRINVFITFCLSWAGMVKHWWNSHERGWQKKLLTNGRATSVLCTFIPDIRS